MLPSCMQCNLVFRSFRKLFHSRVAIVSGFFVTLLLLFLGWRMTDIELSYGNLGATFMNIQIFLYVVFCLLFGVFIAASLYKFHYFGGVSDKKHTTLGSVGGFFGILVAGCPTCAVSVASSIGLAGLISLLPRHGLELKILGLCFVTYATRNILLNIETCEFPLRKRYFKIFTSTLHTAGNYFAKLFHLK